MKCGICATDSTTGHCDRERAWTADYILINQLIGTIVWLLPTVVLCLEDPKVPCSISGIYWKEKVHVDLNVCPVSLIFLKCESFNFCPDSYFWSTVSWSFTSSTNLLQHLLLKSHLIWVLKQDTSGPCAPGLQHDITVQKVLTISFTYH